ncbi:MAG: hypothetical protein COV73_05710 [Candidatus Omnitrophica bacterium CG11_big_fil_rev_8_21_14_0_20_43_6]|nr:MAG: hypothetical protein COV73_05710 [Candidatus Omnitrophica bacterium CG11_big_fil_rev_8_21_14_0_20_43_6]
MKYRRLGRTQISVSEIGFGTWGIGGLTKGLTSYGKTDDSESIKALKVAFDSGVNFFDTSNIYGDGHSEILLGKVFKKLRDKVIIASKVGFLEHHGKQDFSSVGIRRTLENSLKRLHCDYIDLYQLHSPEIAKLGPETVDTLKALIKEGKIREFGISLKSPDDGKIAIKNFGFPVIQVNFNLADQRALENGLFDFCAKEGVGIICRTPLCFGFLSGKYSHNSKFTRGDHRNSWSSAQIERWASACKLFTAKLGNSLKQTNAQISLRFCLSYQQVSTTIPGMLNATEVAENVLSSTLGVFDKKTREEFEKIYKRTEFFITKKPSHAK